MLEDVEVDVEVEELVEDDVDEVLDVEVDDEWDDVEEVEEVVVDVDDVEDVEDVVGAEEDDPSQKCCASVTHAGVVSYMFASSHVNKPFTGTGLEQFPQP